jgi:hypothetical protein
MKRTLLLFICLVIFSKFASAQETTHGDQSPVRSLRMDEYNAYMNGTDLTRRSYIAEVNHYPLPDKLLQYKKELDLSPSQIAAITNVVKFLQMKKKEIGESVIRNERALDSLFRTHKIDEGTIIFLGNRYGLYEGEYRTAVMQACYKTQKLLSERQIKKFEALQQHN